MSDAAEASEPLHVLLTTDVVGGVWDFCWVLANELVQGGSRVTLLAFGEPSDTQRRQADEAGATLVHAPLKLEWMQDSAEDVRTARQLTARLVRHLRPDVLHANQYALGQIELDIPIVLTAHSDVLSWVKWTERDGRPAPIPIEWGQYAALVRRGLESADAVVAVSGFVADELSQLYGLERRPRVIYNGWPVPTAIPVPLAERRRLTLLAGRAWDAAKNPRLAAEAARGWDCGRVLLAGDQRHPEHGHLIELGQPIEPVGRLPRENIDRLLARSRVYLAPARYEPFGLLPLQAALAGCPLLLSDIPSFRELWDGAALFFRADDPAGLRRQWARLLDDVDLAGELAGRARRLAVERYGSARLVANYRELYTARRNRRAMKETIERRVHA
jgi:glycosyltransferase involved in cell wall biosynthesis